MTTIEGYHAHVYFTPATRAAAERVREGLGAGFEVALGRWHDKPVGPHTEAMYQVAFGTHEFARVVPFLMLNREGLSVLVHPLTGNDWLDHGTFALWLGAPLPLKLETLKGAPGGG